MIRVAAHASTRILTFLSLYYSSSSSSFARSRNHSYLDLTLNKTLFLSLLINALFARLFASFVSCFFISRKKFATRWARNQGMGYGMSLRKSYARCLISINWMLASSRRTKSKAWKMNSIEMDLITMSQSFSSRCAKLYGCKVVAMELVRLVSRDPRLPVLISKFRVVSRPNYRRVHPGRGLSFPETFRALLPLVIAIRL